MDFLDDEGVMTRSLQDKVNKLEDLDKETKAVDESVQELKKKLLTIRCKRSTARTALNHEISEKERRLQQRKRRQIQLKAELERLLVCMK